MVDIKINGTTKTIDAPGNTPLLWAIRDLAGLTGTKFGCGAGLCGACTVHVNGKPERSCQLWLDDVAGQDITTIEGLSDQGDHPVQVAWRDQNVP
ncbi:MAG: 2Fe-2S iron-sulfur cluster-binding protein, partial [Pseudoruegeria sp.]